jgi:phage host-nuclease inhibitor protein Gam
MIDNASSLESDATPALVEGETDEQIFKELVAASEQPESDEPQEDTFEKALSDAEAADRDEPEVAVGNPSDDLTPQLERLRHQIKSEIGRTQAKDRKIDTLQKEVARLTALMNESKTTAPSAEAKAKLDKARNEYGDVIGPLADQLEANSKRLDQLTQATTSQLDGSKQQLADLYKEQEAIFRKEHPDANKVVYENRDAFAAWIEDQPKMLRDAYAMNKETIVDGAAAALVVAEFKASLKTASNGAAPAADSKSTLQARRERQLAGSRSERPGGQSAVISGVPADGASDEAYWNYFVNRDRKKG